MKSAQKRLGEEFNAFLNTKPAAGQSHKLFGPCSKEDAKSFRGILHCSMLPHERAHFPLRIEGCPDKPGKFDLLICQPNF